MKSLALILLLSGVAWAGPYKVEDKSYDVAGAYGPRRLPQFYVGDIVLTDKEQAEDFAFMLNEAHERRTRKVEFKPYSSGPYQPIVAEEFPLGGCRER
jgi:hypothetical protein